MKDLAGSEVQIKIKQSSPLRRLMEIYCRLHAAPAPPGSYVDFFVDGYEFISPEDTAEEFGLVDGDVLEAILSVPEETACGDDRSERPRLRRR